MEEPTIQKHPADLPLSNYDPIFKNEQFRAFVSSVDDFALLMLDQFGTITHWNIGAEKLFGYSSEEAVGRSSAILYTSDDNGNEAMQVDLAQASAKGRSSSVCWHRCKDGSLLWIDNSLLALRDESGNSLGFAKRATDASERRTNEGNRSRFAAMINSSADAIFDVSLEGIVLSWNSGAERLFGYSTHEVVGKPISLLVPEDRQEEPIEFLRRIRQGDATVGFETIRQRKDGTFVDVSATMSPIWIDETIVGGSWIIRDISARMEAEKSVRENTRLLALNAEVGSVLTTRDSLRDMLQGCAEAIVVHLGAAFARIWTLNGDLDILELQASAGMYTHLNGAHSRIPVGSFKIGLIAYERMPHLTNSVVGDPRVSDQEWAKQEGMVAFAGYPLLVDDALVGVIAMFAREALSNNTLLALQSVASEIGIGIERRRLAVKQNELLRVSQARTEREILVNQISDAARSSLDPDAIQAITVQLLGKFLGADRCYYAAYDFENDVVNVVRDWHRADLPSMEGALALTNVKELFDGYYKDGTSGAVADMSSSSLTDEVKAANSRYRIRARMSVALIDDASKGHSVIPTLNVAMTDSPRDWTLDELQLIETVAALTRSAIESARNQQREHNIATQLQDALQPPAPSRMPGLALRKYYEAALSEAGVGGDFYDVYPLGEYATVLVVGDLSGKGLAAATQVATVRYMLRTLLYTSPSLADAVTTLNRLLAENMLLTGFATLFVGIFSGNDGTLTYVNCGQEPALVLNKEGDRLKQLQPTGMVLGAYVESMFTQETIQLDSLDSISIFTDGLTEAGPDRRHLLGVDGVASLIMHGTGDSSSKSADHKAEGLVIQLIKGVDAYAADGVRDDVCLVVAVVDMDT